MERVRELALDLVEPDNPDTVNKSSEHCKGSHPVRKSPSVRKKVQMTLTPAPVFLESTKELF